jgi:pre-rRNA-processing protein TSR2
MPDEQYIEEMLLQVMQDEFEVDVQDGSGESVAADILRVWEECSSSTQPGKLLLKYEDLAEKVKGKSPAVQIVREDNEEEGDGEEEEWATDSEDEGEGDGMDVDEAPQLVERRPKEKEEPEVDEDGFTMVKRKR